MHVRACVTSVYSRDLGRSCGQYSTTNCRCDVSAFDLRRSMHRLSKIDVSTFEYRCVALRRSMSQCVDLRRSMCRLSKIDVSTFGDGCVDLRRPMIPMCRPSKIGDWCVDFRTSMVDVKLGCYTCSKYWYYSCMRITPRVCTSVLSFLIVTMYIIMYIIVMYCYVLQLSVHFWSK